MHQAVKDWISFQAKNLQKDNGIVVEFGSYDINGSVREFFPNAKEYIGVDLRDGPGVDVVDDATVYKPKYKPDVVVCCEVFEHTDKAKEIVDNSFDILRVGGVVLFTMAMEPRLPHSWVDGGQISENEYYQNINPTELEKWMSIFDNVDIHKFPERGDLYAFGIKTSNKGK